MTVIAGVGFNTVSKDGLVASIKEDLRYYAEIGAAWPKRSAEQRDYLSVKLDDPSFPAPIYASLVEAEDGSGHNLIWSRRNGD